MVGVPETLIKNPQKLLGQSSGEWLASELVGQILLWTTWITGLEENCHVLGFFSYFFFSHACTIHQKLPEIRNPWEISLLYAFWEPFQKIQGYQL